MILPEKERAKIIQNLQHLEKIYLEKEFGVKKPILKREDSNKIVDLFKSSIREIKLKVNKTIGDIGKSYWSTEILPSIRSKKCRKDIYSQIIMTLDSKGIPGEFRSTVWKYFIQNK